LIMDEELFDQRTADITEWIEEYGESYYDNVMIKRSTNSVFDAYLSGHDVRGVLFPVDRLLRLAEVNAEGLLLSLAPVAEPAERIRISANDYLETNFKQGVAWVPAEVDDVSHLNEVKN